MSRFPVTRLRRLRTNEKIRSLVRETSLSLDQLIYPLFIRAGKNIKKEIPTMPGIYQFSVDRLAEELESLQQLGLTNIILFGLPESKDAQGSSSMDNEEVIPRALREIKRGFPDFFCGHGFMFLRIYLSWSLRHPG